MTGKSEKRNFLQIWHRRSGKDKTNIAVNVPRRLLISPALVKYVYPTLVMGRDNMWEGMGLDGQRFIDHIPEQIRVGKPNNTRMTMEIKGGSKFQIAGSDNPDSLRGGNSKLYIWSEWQNHDPYAWDVVEPILRENDGISIFNLTPAGDNHARALYEFARYNPRWHVELLTAHDTKVFNQYQLEQILKDTIDRFATLGRSEEEAVAYYEQEYLCSFKSPVIGSYYGAAMRKADEENRITNVPYDPNLPVMTFWDIGWDDSTSIWFMQRRGMTYGFIDYYENSGEGLSHYLKKLQEKGYIYSHHYGPHDMAQTEFGAGKTRVETARALGYKFEVVPQSSLLDGIDVARSILSRCWFDKDKCLRGISCLKSYRKEWVEKNKIFRDQPKHDWSSHGADAFRTFAMGIDDRIKTPKEPKKFSKRTIQSDGYNMKMA